MLETVPLKFRDDRLFILDQTLLPEEEKEIELSTAEDVWEAIKKLKVRGAPAIGVCAAYGLYISVKNFCPSSKLRGIEYISEKNVDRSTAGEMRTALNENENGEYRFESQSGTTPYCGGVSATEGQCRRKENVGEFLEYIEKTAAYLNSSRPTAVNLSWALKRIVEKARKAVNEDSLEYVKPVKKAAVNIDDESVKPASVFPPVSELSKHKKTAEIPTVFSMKRMILEEAVLINEEDESACLKMGEYGLELLKDGMGILTHCNAGTIATSKYGTCLAPIHLGKERGYDFKVFADETRPLLQGARLTSWELSRNGIDVTLICDNMASTVMKNGWVDAVVVGCDRMAANGDGANKIGTSGLAILANEYGIPFYMFVPSSTIDFDCPSGEEIPIELRQGEEIYEMWYEKPMAPTGIKTYNPSFDVTNHKYITAVITEKGIVRPPYDVNLRKISEQKITDDKL